MKKTILSILALCLLSFSILILVSCDGDSSTNGDDNTAELTMAVSPNNAGTTDPTVGTHTVTKEEAQNITATPETGYNFFSWTASEQAAIADTISDNTTITLSGNATATANFVASNYDSLQTQRMLGTWEATNINIPLLGYSGPLSDLDFIDFDSMLVTLLENDTSEIVLFYQDSTDTVVCTWSVSGPTLTATLPLIEGTQTATGPYSISEDNNMVTFQATIEIIIVGDTPTPIEIILTLTRRE
jgi:hypothetical protein